MTFPSYFLVKKDQPLQTLWDHLGFENDYQRPIHAPTEILEAKDKYMIRMDVPGVKEADLKLEFTDGILSVSGERKLGEKPEGMTFSLQESAYGKFKRSFRLHEAILEDGISATLKEGILNIVIPKAEEKKPKVITVNKVN